MQAKIILILCLLNIYFLESKAQTKADVFGNQHLPVTWLGIDFSKASYIGDPGTVSPSEMKQMFSNINILMIKEPKKYNFKGVFRKNNMESNISFTEEQNKNIDPDKIQTFDSRNFNKLNPNSIQEIINEYKFSPQDKGVALLFVIEGLNKMTEEAAMWPVFFNMETKEIIFTERLIGKSSGIGFRNHWAGAVHNTLEKIDSNLYKQWKKKYVPSN